MPLWGSTDNTSSSPIFTPQQVNLAPNSANRDNLYINSTADAFVTGQTIGVVGVDDTEIHISSTYLSAAAANNPGTTNSYVVGDILTIDNTGGTYDSSAKLLVTTTKVRTVAILAGHLGTGYANADTVTCNLSSTDMTTNAVFTVTTGASNTSIASLALTTNGVFTTNAINLANVDLKNLTVGNSSANGAQATITTRIASISIYDQGNYTVSPTDITTNAPAATQGSTSNGSGATFALTFSSHDKGITHTGWNKRTTGSGGRAGRVQFECLVAGGISGDGSDDTILPDS